jgi:biopolymer transport protein TolQ
MFTNQGTLWQLVRNADAMTLAVLLVLLGMSVYSWTVLLYKLIVWRVKKQQLATVIEQLKTATNLDDVLHITASAQSTLPGYLLSRSLTYLKSILVTHENKQATLSDREYALLEHVVSQQCDTLLTKEESMIPFVGTNASIGILIGLYGTVWGLINAFMGISHQQTADIAAVAPGIAQALITTIAGLIVTIPASVMFHYLTLELRGIEEQLFAIGDQFMWLTQQLFYGQKSKGE